MTRAAGAEVFQDGAAARASPVLPARMLAWYLSRRKPVMTVEEAQGVAETLAGAVAARP